MLREVLVLGAAGSLAAIASAQTPLKEFPPPGPYDDLGWILYNVGDVDGDGCDDLAVAHPGRFANEEGWPSEVEFYSGATCERLSGLKVCLERFDNDRWVASDACGESLVVVRRDGENFELAVGAPGAGFEGRSPGAVETFTAIDRKGARLRFKGNEGQAEFGSALAIVPDVDGDGVEDLAIGAPGVRDGVVAVYSLADGRALRLLDAPEKGGRFGAALAATIEIDRGKPYRRLAIGAPEDSTLGERAGAVYMFALGDGSPARKACGRVAGERFGAGLVRDDLDADAKPELLVASLGSASAAPVAARVCVLGSESATPKWSFDLAGPASDDGLRIGACADLDGDKRREVLVTFVPADPQSGTEFLVLSGSDGHVIHAIRSIDPTSAASTHGVARTFRTDALGLPLGRRMSAVDAGDQDGDGVHDVWLAMRGDRNGPPMQASIALLSGKGLGGNEKLLPPVLAPCVVVGLAAKTAADVDSEPTEIEIDELPKHFQLEYSDEMDADSRGGACIQSAFGKRIVALGDLDGDGRDELWVSGIAQTFDDYYAFVLRGADGAELRRFKHGDFVDAARVADLDGDGSDDFVVAASDRTFRFCEMIGELLAYSSAMPEQPPPRGRRKAGTETLKEIKDEGGAYEFAAAIETVGDVDGDGVRDLAIATPATRGLAHPRPERASRVCRVDLVAGGKEIGKNVRTLPGNASGADGFGRALAYGGDWDGDGVLDLAVGAPRDSRAATMAGAVHVYSGKSWQCLATFASDVESEGLGREIAWVPDVDGDQRFELVVSAPWSGEDMRRRVVVLSSKSGGVLFEARGERPWSAFGASLGVGDLDGDGASELVVGAPGAWNEGEIPRGTLTILSLRNARVLARIAGETLTLKSWMEGVTWTSRIFPYAYGEPTILQFGAALAIVKNLDGDELPDLVVGAPTYLGPDSGGKVYAISGATLRELMRPREADRK